MASEAVAMFGRFCASQSGNVASSAKKRTFLIFPYIGNSDPNCLSYFSEGLKPPTRYIYHYLILSDGWFNPHSIPITGTLR